LILYLGSQNEDLDASYLVGLMHDVGIHVFDYLIPEEYSYFINAAEESKRTFGRMEIEKFGIPHSELGAEFIGKRWAVSEIVVKSIKKIP
jgi:HD-like signal output (HDOD) protein